MTHKLSTTTTTMFDTKRQKELDNLGTNISAFMNENVFADGASANPTELFSNLLVKYEKYSNKLILYQQRIQDLTNHLTEQKNENDKMKEKVEEYESTIQGWKDEPFGFLSALADDHSYALHPQVRKGIFRDAVKQRGPWKMLGQIDAPNRAMVLSPKRFPKKF